VARLLHLQRLCVVLLACWPAVALSDVLRTGEVRALYFGEVLFHFYQDDHFTALNHLLAAREQGRLDAHADDAELLLGGLYLHYGQHLQAEAIFDQLLTESVNPRVRDRAWFYLGKVRYQRSLFAEALAALERIEGQLPHALAAELPMLQAQAHMALGDFAAAAAVLDRWRGPEDWVPYARYNLGVALVRLGRFEQGAAVLDQLGRRSAATAELRNLRDQANLALGYALLQQDQFDQAVPVLSRVRLAGAFANRALLGVGWAEAARDNYQSALTPWLTLKDRDLLDSAVQESLLAVPYAFGRLDAHSSAASEYQAALVAYDREIGRLDVAIEQAREGGLIAAVLADDDPAIAHWYWQLDAVPDALETRYLFHLIAHHDFQEGLRNFRDLLALEKHLDEWHEKLLTYEHMVATQRLAWQQREPVVAGRLAEVDLNALQAQRDALARRLEQAAASRDISALATGDEQMYWQWLEELEQGPAFAAAPAATRERHRLLKGSLIWQLDADFEYRLWQQGQRLRALDEALLEAGQRDQLIAGVRATAPDSLADYAERIAAVRPRLEQMRQQIAAARTRQSGQLVAQAIGELGEQRDRLQAYRLEAQFALATIYDRATGTAQLRPDSGGQP